MKYEWMEWNPVISSHLDGFDYVKVFLIHVRLYIRKCIHCIVKVMCYSYYHIYHRSHYILIIIYLIMRRPNGSCVLKHVCYYCLMHYLISF